jgi:small ubiquitin-related modifier
MSENDANQSPVDRQDPPPNSEHLNIKVTDNNNEVFFKIKRSTKLEKLMTAFCERQGKSLNSVRFLFDGTRVQPTDTPDAVCSPSFAALLRILLLLPISFMRALTCSFVTNALILGICSSRWPTVTLSRCTKNKLEDACWDDDAVTGRGSK